MQPKEYMLNLTAAFLTLRTLLAYVKHCFVKLPPTIGVMGIGKRSASGVIAPFRDVV